MDRERTFRYFAYGSNMSTERLRGRTPSARALGVGRLMHHTLRWHKLGRDGSGKCDVEPARISHQVTKRLGEKCGLARPSDVVWGVLFAVSWAEKPALDAAEGLGIGYFEKEVRIVTDDGECRALTYHANPDRIDSTLRPRDWYKDYVVRGAREHGLPSHYVRALEQVET